MDLALLEQRCCAPCRTGCQPSAAGPTHWQPASRVALVTGLQWAVLKALWLLELYSSRVGGWSRTSFMRRGGWLAWLADPRAGGWGAGGLRGGGCGRSVVISVVGGHACRGGPDSLLLAACDCCVSLLAVDGCHIRGPAWALSHCACPFGTCPFAASLCGVTQQQCAMCGVVGCGVVWCGADSFL